MFKKKLLAAAVITGAVISGSAYAGTWAATTGAPDFASEVLGATVTLTPTTAVYTMASAPGAGSAFNIAYTLAGGTLDTALTSASVGYAASGTGVAGVTLVSGGAVGDTTATFRVDVTTAIQATDTFTLTYDIAGESMGATATLAATLQDTLGNVDTAGAATTVATSSAGTTLDVAATPTALGNIDVASGSLNFVAGGAVTTTSQQIGSVGLNDTAGVEDDGATAWATNVTDAAITSATVTISGLFGASVGVAGKAGVSLDLDGSGTLAGNTAATTLDATTAVFTLTGANAATAEALSTSGLDVWMTVDGTTQIEEMTATGTIAVNWTNAAYNDSSTGPTSFAALSKNGDSDPIDFLLTPGGAYSNYIRVSNKSSSAGDVFMTLYNDSGDSVFFNLGDISGQASTTLAAQGSTSLINITDAYAAAQVADATFDVGTGKLRVIVSSEIADIEAQAVTISTDGKSFSTL